MGTWVISVLAIINGATMNIEVCIHLLNWGFHLFQINGSGEGLLDYMVAQFLGFKGTSISFNNGYSLHSQQ